MEIVAWVVIGFAMLQLIIAFANAVWQTKFENNWKGDDLVSVLIPARNEEHNIMKLFIDLQHQTYKNLEILVFDDQSTDRTAEYITEMTKNDARIRLIASTGLPEGWLGKNYACHQLANIATGNYLLFLDADVRAKQTLVAKTIAFSKKYNTQLLSIFPTQQMHGMGEKMVVPIMNYILLTLLPLPLVQRSKYASLAAANGQFMLFEAQSYSQLKPHQALKAEKVEDIKTAQLYKRHKLKIACVSNMNDISCRMYGSYNESIEGFSKNIAMFFGNSYLVAFAFWLLTTLGFVAVWAALPLKYLALLTVMTVVTRIFVSISSNQNCIQNLFCLIPQQLNIAVILVKSLINKKNKNYNWKGRIVE